jgi:hypothetical protein
VPKADRRTATLDKLYASIRSFGRSAGTSGLQAEQAANRHIDALRDVMQAVMYNATCLAPDRGPKPSRKRAVTIEFEGETHRFREDRFCRLWWLIVIAARYGGAFSAEEYWRCPPTTNPRTRTPRLVYATKRAPLLMCRSALDVVLSGGHQVEPVVIESCWAARARFRAPACAGSVASCSRPVLSASGGWGVQIVTPLALTRRPQHWQPGDGGSCCGGKLAMPGARWHVARAPSSEGPRQPLRLT